MRKGIRASVAMFTAYFDDSGTERETASVVAGYLAAREQWTLFDLSWREILAPHGIQVFHMTDFVSNKREFKRFEGKDDDKKLLLSQLAGIIAVRTRISFACIVSPKDYEIVNQKYHLREYLGNPYCFCARYCVGRVRQWALQNGHDPQAIVYVFEDGSKGKGDLMQVMKYHGFPQPTFDSKSVPALQAADFVAWECRNAAKMAYEQRLERFSDSFKLLSDRPQDWGIYPNNQKLEEFCIEYKIPRREASGPESDSSCGCETKGEPSAD